MNPINPIYINIGCIVFSSIVAAVSCNRTAIFVNILAVLINAGVVAFYVAGSAQ